MSKVKEEWRDVVGYEGLYQVSDWGNVRSLNYNKTGQVRLLKQVVAKDKYLVVTLSKNGKQKEGKVHRLVAEAFIPNPESKKEVGHLKTLPNGFEDKTANEAWNLAWMTRKENANYGTLPQRLSEHMVENNPMKRKEVAAKVAEYKRVLYKKLWVEHPEYFEGLKNSDKHSNKLKIKVNQYNIITDELIKTWDSATDVERELGIFHSNIAANCNGKINSAGGFKWRYANGN